MTTVNESIVSHNQNTQTHRKLLSVFIREMEPFEGKPAKSKIFSEDEKSPVSVSWSKLQEALESIYGSFNTQSPKFVEKFSDRRIDRVNLGPARKQLETLEEDIHRMDTLETLDYSVVDSAFSQLLKARKEYDDAKSNLPTGHREGFGIWLASGVSRG